MCHITDLLFDGSLLALSINFAHLLLSISSTDAIIVCCQVHELNLGNKVHTKQELQLALQIFFLIIYLLVKNSIKSNKMVEWFTNNID